jgi:hypothetical protein
MTPFLFTETILASPGVNRREKRKSVVYLAGRVCDLALALTTGSKPDSASADAVNSVATGRVSGPR